jgi:hypothetical protein
MNVRRVITALVAIPLICTPISAQAAPSPVSFGSMNGNGVKYPLGEEILIFMCWGTKPQTSLLLKTDGTWAAVAKSTVTKNTKVCGRKFPYRHAYRWSVTGKPDPNGAILIAVSKGSQPSYVDVVYTTSPADPSATPVPTIAPAPAPAPIVTQAPLYTLTSADTAYVSKLWDVAKTQPDRQLSRCRSLASPAMDADSREFYELGAWSGEQLYKLTHQGALVATKLAYSIYCDGAFGIQTRIL